MDSRHRAWSDEMLLALAVWLCSLPLVALLVIPWLGWQIAFMAVVVLLIVALLACWGASGVRDRERHIGRKNKT
jgi:hypothetical protein